MFSLVHIGRDTFIMLNAKAGLKNSQCNRTIFKNKLDANLDTDVFDYFGVKVNIIIDKLDRRTSLFKQFLKDYQYFSVSFLPKIVDRKQSNRLSDYTFLN